MKLTSTAALIAAPLLALSLTACGGGSSPAANSGNGGASGATTATDFTCDSFDPLMKTLNPTAKLPKGVGEENQPSTFVPDAGPDCRWETAPGVLADNINLDLSTDDPYDYTPSTATASGNWDFIASSTATAKDEYKKIREGEWFECSYGGSLTPNEAGSASKFCDDALALAQANPLPKDWPTSSAQQ